MNYGDSVVIFCSLKKLVLLTKDVQAVKKVQGGSSTTFFADLNLDLGCQKKLPDLVTLDCISQRWFFSSRFQI